jgi:hypothetical protein
MEHHYQAIVVNWTFNILFGVVALVVALSAIALVDRYVFKGIDFLQEVKEKNTSAAIVFAAMLGFTAYIIGAALK